MRFFRAPDSSRWVVQSKDGTRFDFGRLDTDNALQSDPEDETRAFAWLLARMSDAHGSTVHYRYLHDAGGVYLADIYYSSPARCGVPGAPEVTRECNAPLSAYGRRVRLVYEDRDDITSSYITTWRVETALRLRRIEVTASTDGGARSLVRRYHLTYDPDSFHSLLDAVQVEGRPDTFDTELGVPAGDALVPETHLGEEPLGAFLPAMRFAYSEPPASEGLPGFGGVDVTVHSSHASPPHSADEGLADLFDVNADGLPDLLVTDPGTYEEGAGVFFNGFGGDTPTRGGDFSSGTRVRVPRGMAGDMTLSNANVVPMDVDGDGRSDLLHMP